jgi:hypothetical protein
MANNSAVQAMLASGADAQKNMFDVWETFPWNPNDEVVLSTRAQNFEVKEANVGMDERKYHGTTVNVPKTSIEFERKFSLEFRLDASYSLYQQFITWHQTVADPVNGGVANWAAALGTVKVTALSGAYNGTSTGDIYNAEDGSITGDANPTWTFYDVWVSKVGQPQFKTAGGDALTYAVSFKFGDCDYPFYNATGITGTGDGGAVK